MFCVLAQRSYASRATVERVVCGSGEESRSFRRASFAAGVFAAAAMLSVGIGQVLNLALFVRALVPVEMRTPVSLALRVKLLGDAPPVVDEGAKTASVKATAVIASPAGIAAWAQSAMYFLCLCRFPCRWRW